MTPNDAVALMLLGAVLASLTGAPWWGCSLSALAAPLVTAAVLWIARRS